MTRNDADKLRAEFAHYKRSHSLLHETERGELTEFRRIFTPDRPAYFIEHRVLGPGGVPYWDCPDDGPWYLVDDARWLYMIYNAAEILGELCSLEG